MDTLRDRQVLEDMVEQGEMPWRVHLDAALEAGAPASADGQTDP